MCILFGIFLAKSLGETALTGLLVERRKIMTRLTHHLHHFIKRHTVMTVGERGIQVGIQGTGCSKGITLDTRYLNQSAYRVAGHTQVMFQTHLGSILHLGRTSTK